jgi:hypothetical protein
MPNNIADCLRVPGTRTTSACRRSAPHAVHRCGHPRRQRPAGLDANARGTWTAQGHSGHSASMSSTTAQLLYTRAAGLETVVSTYRQRLTLTSGLVRDDRQWPGPRQQRRRSVLSATRPTCRETIFRAMSSSFGLVPRGKIGQRRHPVAEATKALLRTQQSAMQPIRTVGRVPRLRSRSRGRPDSAERRFAVDHKVALQPGARHCRNSFGPDP